MAPEQPSRSMPQSAEAEVAVLGSILLNPGEALDLCSGVLTPEHFFQRSHQIIYSILDEMQKKGEPIDTVSVSTRLKDAGKLEEIGGAYYLSKLSVAFPTAAHVRFYVDILREKHQLRQLIDTCTNAIDEAFKSQENVDGLMDRVETGILKICDDQAGKEALSIKEISERIVENVNRIHENRGKLPGLSWGFRDLNKITFGLRSGEMIVVAARPGIGKTSLAMNVAEKLVLNEKIPVAVFSLEMTAEQLALRLACSIARINVWDLYHGGVPDRMLQEFSRAAHVIGNSPLHIVDTSQMSIAQVRATARRLQKRSDIKMIIIDYLQLMVGNSSRADSREREVATISNGIKALAKELSVPIIVLSQLNRNVEQRDDRKPKLSDLRESGAIEQDADIVCLLSRKDAYEEGTGTPLEAIPAEVIIAKNRNGPVGEIPLTFFPKYTRFEDLSPHEAS
ncbi:MAG: replicative DNA helicase [Verrucomicrobiae bacterium]|nr:replicative DNA helicase [Verrucomicrobiae bacterium]